MGGGLELVSEESNGMRLVDDEKMERNLTTTTTTKMARSHDFMILFKIISHSCYINNVIVYYCYYFVGDVM